MRRSLLFVATLATSISAFGGIKSKHMPEVIGAIGAEQRIAMYVQSSSPTRKLLQQKRKSLLTVEFRGG